MHYVMHVHRVNDGFNIEVSHVSPGMWHMEDTLSINTVLHETWNNIIPIFAYSFKHWSTQHCTENQGLCNTSPTINLGELRKIYTDNASLSTWVNSKKFTKTMHQYQPGWTEKNIHRQCITINLGELRKIYTDNASLSTWVNSEIYISCICTELTMVSILKSSMCRQVSDLWKTVTPRLISKYSLTRTHEIKLSHFSHIHSK